MQQYVLLKRFDDRLKPIFLLLKIDLSLSKNASFRKTKGGGGADFNPGMGPIALPNTALPKIRRRSAENKIYSVLVFITQIIFIGFTINMCYSLWLVPINILYFDGEKNKMRIADRNVVIPHSFITFLRKTQHFLLYFLDIPYMHSKKVAQNC